FLRVPQPALADKVLVIDADAERVICHYQARQYNGTSSIRTVPSPVMDTFSGEVPPAGMAAKSTAPVRSSVRSSGFVRPGGSPGVSSYSMAVWTLGSVSTTSALPSATVKGTSTTLSPTPICAAVAGPMTVHTGQASSSPGLVMAALAVVWPGAMLTRCGPVSS